MGDITWHHGRITKAHRQELLGHPNKVFWLTGLSGSGKSTIAHALEEALFEKRIPCYVLDGDNVRHGLNADLGFSAEDRKENIRRVSEVAKLLHDAGITVIVSFISPYLADRAKAREVIGEDFLEVHVHCPLEECEGRDPKGLYKKARAGEIDDFTGISAPYEEPTDAALVLDTSALSVEECVERLLGLL